MTEKAWSGKLYQVQMVEYECSLVHLAQDKKHLIVNKLFILPEVAAHMLLQLISDLKKWTNKVLIQFNAPSMSKAIAIQLE